MSENQINLSADNETVKAVVTQIKSDMRGGARYAAYVAEFSVTRESVKDHAVALATLVYPKSDGTQTKNGARTPFGNAVQAAGNGLRRALPTEETDKPVTLRASLSGEGGGSTVIPADHPLYEAIVALIAGGNES